MNDHEMPAFVVTLRAWWDRYIVGNLERVVPDGELWGSTTEQWAAALGVFVLGVILLPTIKGLVRLRVQAVAERDEDQYGWLDAVADMIKATRFWFLVVVAAFLATFTLNLEPRAIQVVRSAVAICLVLQAAIWTNGLVNFLVGRHVKRRMDKDAASVTTAKALALVARIALWSVAVLLVMDNLGIDVTALVAGLGVGGIAVALAAQNILGDLFASLSIALDKPFVIGDFIIVGDMMGTVENIGMKTTRVRSLSGEQLIFPNSDLLSSRVRNFKRMQERRIVFSVGVTYQTPAEKARAIPGIIKESVESQEQVRFDRAHLQKFGDSALVYEVVYYVLTPDYNLYMDIQQQINFFLFERFAREGIEFAYPTQTVFAEIAGAAGNGSEEKTPGGREA